MNMEETKNELFKKLDSNVYLTGTDKQALKNIFRALQQRLSERDDHLKGVSGSLLEKDGHIRFCILQNRFYIIYQFSIPILIFKQA